MDIYNLLKVVSDPSRLRILSLLTRGPLSAGEVDRALNLSQANTSKHLKRLVECGVLSKQKIGITCIYELDPEYLNKCLIFEPIMTTFAQHEDSIRDVKRLKGDL